MDSQQELTLIKKAKNGDRQALAQLWDKITPKLFGYLVNTLKDKILAEDILQNTWLKAMEALPKFQPEKTGISPWLFAIARNECRQHWRKAKWEEPIDDNPANLNKAIINEPRDVLMVEQILSRLSEDDCQILRLKYIADLPIKDIAQTLNLNSIAVRVRLHRAVLRAQKMINQQPTI